MPIFAWSRSALEVNARSVMNNDTVNAPCTSGYPGGFRWFQPLLNQDYSFFVPAPPKPGGDTQMVFGAEDHCGEVPSNPSNPTEDHPGLGTPPQRMFGDIEGPKRKMLEVEEMLDEDEETFGPNGFEPDESRKYHYHWE